MDIYYYFDQAVSAKASDLHLVEGSVPAMRVNGSLERIGLDIIPAGELRYAVFNIIDEATKERFLRKKDLDISLNFSENRFRINLHFQEGKIGLSARFVSREIPSPADVGFNEVIYKLTHLNDGLVLVTGPSGAGKSTTLAVMIDLINSERNSHIITIEDPIEYSFHDKKSIIEQRQLGRDTQSFYSALKYALRQDPNVIMVGEMRDLDTVTAALTAAETGHLVFSTLHTSTAIETISRIVDIFPTQQHSQVLGQLSRALRAVVTQQILPKKDGGLIVAREIMFNTGGVSNLIRQNQLGQIYSAIETGYQEGMITMNKAVENLYKAGLIHEDTAKNRRRDLNNQFTYY